jgi:hypothetical protein
MLQNEKHVDSQKISDFFIAYHYIQNRCLLSNSHFGDKVEVIYLMQDLLENAKKQKKRAE